MSGMAEVLRKHHADGGYNYDLEWQICTCGTSYAPRTHDTHVEQALASAGFGPVKEAWDEGYTTGNAHNGRRDANPYRAAAVRGEG